jgi:hypothetical protein
VIYSRAKCVHPDFKEFSLLTEARYEPGSIYWHDQHDVSIRSIEFNHFLDESHWEHIRTDPTAKILLFYGDEYFNINDVNWFVNTILARNINPAQVYLVTIDENWAQWAEQMFVERGIIGVNVQGYNVLLGKTKTDIQDTVLGYRYKFSALSRNYNKWRLRFFLEMVSRGIISNFNYTFNNIHPYASPIQIIEKQEIKNQSVEFRLLDDRTSDWIDKMPYTLKEDAVENKWTDHSYFAIKRSDIHILIESHFDPFMTNFGQRSVYRPDYFSPAFPTEKTYKVMSCKTPFIAYTTPYFLKELKQLGYKTFSPWIDESYDNIEDDTVRVSTIVQEIERINNLNTNSYDTLVKSCQAIAEENYAVLIEKKNNIQLLDNFSWIKNYMHSSIDYGT